MRSRKDKMGKEEIKKELYENVLNGDFELIKDIALKAIAENVEPLEAINSSLVPQ